MNDDIESEWSKQIKTQNDLNGQMENVIHKTSRQVNDGDS